MKIKELAHRVPVGDHPLLQQRIQLSVKPGQPAFEALQSDVLVQRVPVTNCCEPLQRQIGDGAYVCHDTLECLAPVGALLLSKCNRLLKLFGRLSGDIDVKSVPRLVVDSLDAPST
ncbi:hypothetical protein B7435_24740 [Mycolicibacterium peregrinum]|nr:hypothetical protein B7435_24740 [Mycolicibacterium peregrinum]